MKNKDIVSITSTFERRVKKSLKFKNFKKEFYIKLILNELFENYDMPLLDHKKISLGGVHEKDLDMFYAQGKMLIREGIIKGSNDKKDAFLKKGDWRGLITPEIVINDIKLNRILNADELDVIEKIEKTMSENNQTNISVTGNNNNIANGNNNSQIITINECELIDSILDSLSKVKNEIHKEKYNEIINVLEEMKSSPKNKAELWERLMGLTADVGTVGNMILKAIIPFLQ